MVKRTLLIILSVLILTQLVLALPTEIRVKTLPYNEVIVTINKNGQVVERFTGSSNYFGDVVFKYSSSSKTFDMYVQVRNLKETLYFESYPDTEAGETQLIELYPSDFVFPEPINRENKTQQAPLTGGVIASNITIPTNETNVSSTEVIEELTSSGSTANTLQVENGEIKVSLNTLYYALGGLIVLILVILLIRRIVKKRRDNPYYDYKPAKGEVKVRKLSELMEDRGDLSVPSHDFVKAEKKLHEAEAQINRMKNQDRIDSIKKKIEEQQRELKRLQRG